LANTFALLIITEKILKVKIFSEQFVES